MTLNDRLDLTAREDELDAAAGRGLSSFVSFLKTAARDAETHREESRREFGAT
jgi:hypothetical protein